MVKIKLLQVVNDAFALPFFIGEQFEYFKNREIEQYVACPESAFLDKYLKKIDIPYFEVPITRSFSPFMDVISIWKLYRILRRNKFTHVFGHTPKGAMVAMIASYLAGVKHRVYFRHGLLYETASGFRRGLLIFIEKITSCLATKIVNVSPSVAKRVKLDGIKYERKSILLSRGTCNGVNIDKFSNRNRQAIDQSQILRQSLKIMPSDFVVGFVGRMVKDKGIIDLIEAWEIIKKEEPKLKLLLIGPFEKRDAIPANIWNRISDLDNIVHIDFTEDVAPYYCLMDILVLPSYREGFPTVILEASAMSIPVLTSRATGCVDAIIDGETGLHIEHDAKDIADKIKFYHDNASIKKLHGKNGRQFVTSYFQQQVVWRDIGRKLFALIDR